MHILIKKCYKVYNNVVVVENEDESGDENILGSRLYLFSTVSILVIVFIVRTSLVQWLPPRFRFLILQELVPIFCFIPIVLYFYYKNPLLRNFVWVKMINPSTVHPQEIQNEIELESR